MFALEGEHWWFWGKRHLMRRLLAQRLGGRHDLRILDVGCGGGANAAELASHGAVTACDRSLDALGFARRRGIDRVVAAEGPFLPFRDASFDLVTAYDVLEHVRDDAAFAVELARVLRPGGALALHVPAWPFLWSAHDEALEHQRRYTRRALASVIAAAGLELERLTWASCAIFVPTAAVRLLRRRFGREAEGADLGTVPAPLGAVLRGVYRAEAEIAAAVGLPIGVSLAAIAARRER